MRKVELDKMEWTSETIALVPEGGLGLPQNRSTVRR